MAPLASRQPFKALATLALLFAAPPYMIALSIIYSFKRFRLVSTWSLKNAIGNEFMRLFFAYAATVRMKPVYASAAKLKDQYVLVKPGSSDLYVDVLKNETVQPTAMPAIWTPAVPSEPSSERVVIHFQGGAFVLAPDPAKTGPAAGKMFKEEMGASTFFAQYRLARDDSSRFPAAIQDAVSFYRHILRKGVDPKNVIISGDSAGGGVALGLIRYIETTKVLPPPGGAMLWSPWVDVSETALQQYAKNKNLRIDFLGLKLLRWGAKAYEPQPRYKTAETECYLRPVEHPFPSRTPIFVHAGTAELFHEEVSIFVERMKGIEGNSVRYVETKDAMHDLLLCGESVGFGKEAQDAVKAAGVFLGVAK